LPWSWRRARRWRSPEPRTLRREVSLGRAGSRRRPGSCGSVGGARGLHPALERLEDAHAPAAAGTRWEPIERFWRLDRLWRRRGHGKQFAGADYIGLACGTGEQAVMADAVEATWQDMEQEAADGHACERPVPMDHRRQTRRSRNICRRPRPINVAAASAVSRPSARSIITRSRVSSRSLIWVTATAHHSRHPVGSMSQ